MARNWRALDAATGPGDQAPDRRKQAEGVGARASDIRFVGLFALNTDPIIGARFPRADAAGTIVTPQAGQIGGRSSSMPRLSTDELPRDGGGSV